MTEHERHQQIQERIASRRSEQLPKALVKAAAHGLTVRESIPEWLQDRLSTDQIAQASEMAESNRAYIDAIQSADDETDTSTAA